MAHDLAFHRGIAELSGNSYLSGILEQLSSATLRARVWRGVSEAGAVARTLDEHRGIVAAMASSDAGLAHALATVHVAGVEEWLAHAIAGVPD
jgi:DNA-binding FadR family transcriptional regulator